MKQESSSSNGIQPALRTSKVESYYFASKLQQISKMQQSGVDVINLGIGSPDLPPAPKVIETLMTSAAIPGHHAYQSYKGTDAFRSAIAGWYNSKFDVQLDAANEILPLMGSKEGITHISMAFLNPGDAVLLPDPGYPAYESAALMAGAKVQHYRLSAKNNWLPDLQGIEKSLTPNVKLMWLNYPHMPTGALASKHFFEEAVAFARRNSILLCNDNPYAFILNDHPVSLLSVAESKGFCLELNSLSKSHNMAGWRMGMVAGGAELISEVLKVKSNMDSGMFRPLQDAAVVALGLGNEWYIELNNIYRSRRDKVLHLFDMLSCKVEAQQAGLFVWGQLPASFPEASEMSDTILDQTGVFITPGMIFGKGGKRYLRASLCVPENRIDEAGVRIARFVGNNHLFTNLKTTICTK